MFLFLKRILTGIALVFSCALPGVQAEEKSSIRFIPQWIPQAQFAGYYVAAEKGIYQRYGLHVDLLNGGPALPPPEAMRSGKADCGTFFLANGIVERMRGLPILNIAQIVQRSAQLLVTRANLGIESPKDMEGKKVGLWGDAFQVQAQALFRKYGVHVHVVPQTVSVNLFLRGGVDIASAMWHNEYHALLNAGLEEKELKVFFFDQFGLNFPEDGIYCTAEFVRQHKKEACAFAKASIEGWEFVLSNPEEALSIVMQQVEEKNSGTNLAHQRWMLSRMRDIIWSEGAPAIGTLLESDFNRVAAELKNSALISELPLYNDLYLNCEN